MTSGTWDPSPERPEMRWHRWLSGGDEEEAGLLARLRPAEGWLSIPLVMLLAATMAWSFADARWVLGNDVLTSFLVWVGPLAALWGYLSSRFELPRWAAHFLGAVIAALVLSVTVGYVVDPSAANPRMAFDATSESVAQAYLDLAWRHQLSTTQYGHFCLFLGILVWGTAQAAAYDVFGHKRAVNGVLLLGVALVANMALTVRDQFGALVVFSAAALALLIQSHAADERATWLRHRIWRARETETPHAQGGFVFGTAAIVLALVLTTVASSAPLQNAWPGVSGNVQDFAIWLGRYLPSSGGGRIPTSGDFGSSSAISNVFVAQDADVFQVRAPFGEGFHWRMATYDKFSSTGWEITASKDTLIPAGSPLEDGTQDAVAKNAPARQSVTIGITLQDRTIQHLITADEPVSVDEASKVTTIGTGTASHVAWATIGATSYTITASVLDLNPTTGVTANRLRVAGTDYPPGLQALYTQGTQFVGVDGRNLLAEINASSYYNAHALDNNYDKAKAIEEYLQADPNTHPGGFTYNENITSIVSQCTGISTVDCFARYRQGFCQQYATTMTMLLRLEGIPARYVLGYLPGTLNPDTKVRQVTRRQQHAWVEAYFPTYGWIEFDPTGGNQSYSPSIAQGPVVSPRPNPTVDPNASAPVAGRTPRIPREGGTSTGGTTTGGGSAPVALIFGLLGLFAVIVLALVFWRRPPKIEPPDTVYRSVVRLASWLGYRPLPTQTVYEYTGMLGRVVPGAAPQLDVVAMAKVETAYAKRDLPRDRLETLARARSKLRWALMRLAFRRPRRRRGRR